MKMISTLFLGLSYGVMVSGVRINGMAQELNKGHPDRHRRSGDLSLRYAIVFTRDTTPDQWSSFEETYHDFIVKKFNNFKIMHLEIPDSLAQDDVILEIRSLPQISAVEHVLEVHETGLFYNKDRLQTRNFEDLPESSHDFQGNGYGTYMYFIDSGIDDHSEFGTRIDRDESKTFGTRVGTDSYDCRGHGTQVAGVAAGTNVGVAKHATIVSYAVMDCIVGTVTTDIIIEALDSIYTSVLAHPERKVVINFSNGLTSQGETDESLNTAEEYLHELGAVIIRAAGNFAADACLYGQQLSYSLTVGAINDRDELSKYSNYGSCVDLYAPGDNNLVPQYSADGNFGSLIGTASGTSFAAPAVSGLAAILMAQRDIKGEDVFQALVKESTKNAIKYLTKDSLNRIPFHPKVPIIFEDELNMRLVSRSMQGKTGSCPVVKERERNNLQKCADKLSPGVNSFDYNMKTKLCTERKCDGVTFNPWSGASDTEPGTIVQYADEKLIPQQMSNFIMEPNFELDEVLYCQNGTSLVLGTNSAMECISKAQLTRANVINFEVSNSTCELISCPIMLPVVSKKATSGDWYSYKDLKFELPTKISDYRFISSSRNRFLGFDSTCAHLSSKKEADVTVEKCVQETDNIEGNAFQIADGVCEIYKCTKSLMAEGSDTSYVADQDQRDTHDVFATYVKSSVKPSLYRGFSLISNSLNKKISCEKYSPVETLNVEECSVYTLLSKGNAFNFKEANNGLCEPVLCAKEYITSEVSGEEWLMYANLDRFTDSATSFLVHVDASIDNDTFDSLVDSIAKDFEIVEVEQGDLSEGVGKFKNIIVKTSMVYKLRSVEAMKEVLAIEQHDLNSVLSVVYESGVPLPNTPIASFKSKTSAILENSFTRYSPNGIPLVNLRARLQQLTDEQSTSSSLYGSTSSGGSSYDVGLNTHGSQGILDLYGGYGILDQNGGWGILDLYGGYGILDRNGGWGILDHNGGWGILDQNGGWGILDLNGEWGVLDLNGQWDLSGENGDSGLLDLNGEWGLLDLHGGWGILDINGGFGILDLNGGWGILDLNGGWEILDLNGGWGILDLNGAFGVLDLNGEWGLLDLNGEWGLLDLNGGFGILDLNGGFGVLDVNGGFGLLDNNGGWGVLDLNGGFNLLDKHGGWGRLDVNGEWALLDEHGNRGLLDVNGGFELLDLNGEWGRFNEDGKFGLYDENGNWGILDTNGEWGKLDENGGWGLFDSQGNWKKFDANGNWGLYDSSGKFGRFDENGNFGLLDSNGEFGRFDKNGNFGILDHNGEFGLLDVNGGWGVLDVNGQWAHFDKDGNFGLYDEHGNWGILDTNGEWGKLDENGGWGLFNSEGIWKKYDADANWGLFNANGDFGHFDEYGNFGLLDINGEFGRFDKYGNFGILDHNGEFGLLDVNGGWGLLDVNGEWARFDKDGNFGLYDEHGNWGILDTNGGWGKLDENGGWGLFSSEGTWKKYDADANWGLFNVNGDFGHFDEYGNFGLLDINGEFGRFDKNGNFGILDHNGEFGLLDINGEWKILDEQEAFGLLDENGYFGLYDSKGNFGRIEGNFGLLDENGYFGLYNSQGYFGRFVGSFGLLDENGYFGLYDSQGNFGRFVGDFGLLDENGYFGLYDKDGNFGFFDVNMNVGRFDKDGKFGRFNEHGTWEVYDSDQDWKEILSSMSNYGLQNRIGGFGVRDWFNEYGVRDWYNEYGVRDWYNEYGVRDWYNEYQSPDWYNDYGVRDWYNEYGVRDWYNEYGVRDWFNEYGSDDDTNAWGINWLDEDYSMTFLNISGSIEAGLMSGVNDFNLSTSERGFGLSVHRGDFGFPQLFAQGASPSLDGDYGFPLITGVASAPTGLNDATLFALFNGALGNGFGRESQIGEIDGSNWTFAPVEKYTTLDSVFFFSNAYPTKINSEADISSLNFIKTFQKTGCPNEFYVGNWSLYSDIGLQNMFDICQATADGFASGYQKDACCGEGNDCVPTCELQTDLVNVYKYVESFVSTGCPNSYDNSAFWSSQEDLGLSDMFNICEAVASGSATAEQTDACCGKGKVCTPKCTLRTATSLPMNKVYKLVSDSRKNTHLECADSRMFENVKNVNECASHASFYANSLAFMYNPALRQCISQKCTNSYKTKVSSSGWLAYVSTGFFPENLHGFISLPTDQTKLTCAVDDEYMTTYGSVSSAEACISIAHPRAESVVSYKVGTGECHILDCTEKRYKWTYTNETDLVVFVEEDSNIEALDTIIENFESFEHADAWTLQELANGYKIEEATLSTLCGDTDITSSYKYFYGYLRKHGFPKSAFNFAQGFNICLNSVTTKYTIVMSLMDKSIPASIATKYGNVAEDDQKVILKGSTDEDNAYISFDLFVSTTSQIDIFISMQVEDRSHGVYAYIGQDLSNFESEKTIISSSHLYLNDVQFSQQVSKGHNKLYLVQKDANVAIKEMKLSRNSKAHFSRTQNAKPLKWSDFVSINADFNDGENRGRSIASVDSLNVGGKLEFSEKLSEDDKNASFQLLRPESTPSSDCIKWTDSIILSLHSNHEADKNCGPYGCRVASVNSNNEIIFNHGGDNPDKFSILPPAGFFRSNEQCVMAGDRFVLVASKYSFQHGIDSFFCGFHGCSVGSIKDNKFTLTKGNQVSFLTFRHLHRNRYLDFGDHVVINTGFVAGGSILGEATLYTESTVDNVELKVDLKSNFPNRTSFRLLPSETFNIYVYDPKCIRWNEEIVLKLNNIEVQGNCTSWYGCRIAASDVETGLVSFSEKPERTKKTEVLTIVPPAGLRKEGCVRSGEQFVLRRNTVKAAQKGKCGKRHCLGSTIDLDNKSFSFTRTGEELLSFQKLG